MQKFFLVTSFFLIPIILIAQTDDIDGKLKAQEEQQKLEEEANKKTDTLTTEFYKIYYLDGRTETVDTSLCRTFCPNKTISCAPLSTSCLASDMISKYGLEYSGPLV